MDGFAKYIIAHINLKKTKATAHKEKNADIVESSFWCAISSIPF